MMDRTKVLAELEAARREQKALAAEYPELPLLIAQLRRRFDPNVFRLINDYFALEARVANALGALRQGAAWTIDPPADTEALYEGEDGA